MTAKLLDLLISIGWTGLYISVAIAIAYILVNIQLYLLTSEEIESIAISTNMKN